MLRASARPRTYTGPSLPICRGTQNFASLSKKLQSDKAPSASAFRYKSAPWCNRASPLLSKGRRRLIVQNAGGPAGGVTKSKGGKGKEVSCTCACRHLKACSFAMTYTYLQNMQAMLTAPSILEQVDTPGKKLLVGVAVGYLALVLLVPTLNVFVQVSCSTCTETFLCQ